MGYLKLGIVLTLIVSGALLSGAQRDTLGPVDLIRQAEAGSEAAFVRLESLIASGELAQHADLVGAAATRVSAAAAETDVPKGFVSRWHRLFFATDPVQNATVETRKEFVRSLYRSEPIFPDEVLAGRKYPVGENVVGTLPQGEIDELDPYWVHAELKSITAGGTEVWPYEGGLTSVESMWPLARPKGNGGGSSVAFMLLDENHDFASGDELTVRMKFDVSVMDQSTDPPTPFVSWTEELVANPKVKLIFATSPIEPRQGEATLETVLALLANAESGDEDAAKKLVELGEKGELRPHADELGSRLADALRADWQPRMAAYFEEHGWESERPGAHPLPTPNDQAALLIGLFFLADPVSSATRETWMEVAAAGVYAHHRIALDDAESSDARLQIKIVTALVQPTSLTQVSGIGFSMETVDFDEQSWPLQMSSSQRVTSMTEPPPHWRSHIAKMVRQQSYAHGLSEDMAALVAERQGQIINDLRTHIVLRLLHDEESALATWPVTIETPVMPAPLDEPTPDHR